MRRPIVVALIVGSLLVACSEQPTEPPTQPPAGAELDVGPAACSLNNLLDLTKALFPPSPQLNAIIAILKALPTRPQQRIAALIRATVFGIIDAVSKAYKAGKLAGGKSAATQAHVLAFINGLYCFVGLPTPNIPLGALDPNEGAIAVIMPNSPQTLVQPGNKHSGLLFPAASVPVPVTITISRLPDSPGPLKTSLDQFPLFYEFTSSPDVNFTKNVTGGVCLLQNNPLSGTFRLAHNVAPFGFGDVEVLPPATAPVDCSTLVGALPANRGFLGGAFAMLSRTILPADLHASTALLLTAKVGGTLKHLSPFGSVNPNSNPGSIQTVDENGNPTDGVVTGPGTVFVKATSRDGAIIAGVPVTFEETTVLTGSNGIASFDWTSATPGATLTASVPNQSNDGPPSCPSDIPSPGPTAIYRPLVCFTPSQVTFEAVGSLNYGATGYRYFIFSSGAPPEGFEGTSFDDSSWLLGDAAFGFHSPENPACTLIDNAQTIWPAGSAEVPSLILLRRRFALPGSPSAATVSVAVDNDIRVFVNGHEITSTALTDAETPPAFGGGFALHEGCPSRGSLTFTVEAPDLNPGVNLLVIEARDRGGSTYIDAEVTQPSF
jgi:hypothetical protein